MGDVGSGDAEVTFGVSFCDRFGIDLVRRNFWNVKWFDLSLKELSTEMGNSQG